MGYFLLNKGLLFKKVIILLHVFIIFVKYVTSFNDLRNFTSLFIIFDAS